jgi:cytosine/adenosine deaminase-related metal-dependent hydrolase
MNLKRRDFLRWMLIQLGVLFGGEMLSACASTGSDERPEEGHSPTPIDPERNPYEDAIPLDDQIVSFENINVIPMNQEHVLFDQTVIVQGGRIQEIGPASSINIPDETTRVDATDKYLLPGFSDMHIHLEGDAWNIMFPDEDKFAAEDLDFERLLFPYISNGVVMAEIMSALPDHIPLRDQIDRGEKMGPRLILARMIDGPGQAWPPPVSTWVDTASEARSAVLGAREQGYDRMKVYSFLKPECYDAILATAQEMNMLVDGHIPTHCQWNMFWKLAKT